VLERERQIFAGSWQYVGYAGQVRQPGDYFATHAAHVPVVVVRDEEGALRSFLNVCRHRGAEIARGSGNRRTLQCPYHAWTYRLDGSLLAAPRSEREGAFVPEEHSLRAVAVETLGPLVFVNPSGEGPAFAEVTEGVRESLAEGGIDLDALVHRTRIEYELEANWKVVIENYLECYHCPTAHPGFSSAVDVNPDRYVMRTAHWSSSQYAHARNGAGPIETAQFHFLWPNTRINVFAGPPNLSVGAAMPIAPDRTGGFFDYFFGEHVADDDAEELIAFDSEVGAEDRALVESVQRGMRSGLIDHGRLLAESERLIAHFQALVRDALDT
jgi:phenylpropionate dioxygenase-like ring-hydroxylating dioxygenase large terminal subunit